jgi:hypothetical protein
MTKLISLKTSVLSIMDHKRQAKVVAANPEENTITLQIAEGVTAVLDVSEYVTKVNLESDTDVQSIEDFTGRWAQFNNTGNLVGFEQELIVRTEPTKSGTSGKSPGKVIPSNLKV